MKKTINKNLYLRLEAQAQEAKTIGLTKVASSLDNVVGAHDPRTDVQENRFVFSSNELDSLLKNSLWDVLVKVADYYGCSIDAVRADTVVDGLSRAIKAEVRNQGAVRHDVGAYEPKLPGEED